MPVVASAIEVGLGAEATIAIHHTYVRTSPGWKPFHPGFVFGCLSVTEYVSFESTSNGLKPVTRVVIETR